MGKGTMKREKVYGTPPGGAGPEWKAIPSASRYGDSGRTSGRGYVDFLLREERGLISQGTLEGLETSGRAGKGEMGE